MRQALRDCRKNCIRIHNSVNGFISRGTPIESHLRIRFEANSLVFH